MNESHNQMPGDGPDIERLRAISNIIEPYVIRTPTTRWPVRMIGGVQELYIKLELLQRTGSFKPRGAVNSIWHAMQGSPRESFPGVTAFSAGNHAIATAYAAKMLGTSAKVVMPRTANPFRRQQCEALGAELVFGDTISDLLQIVQDIQSAEGRHLVHPFEGIHTIEGTATVGLELCDDIPDLDAVVVPIGGGGLIAGVACAVRQMQPQCDVIGVEPIGASGMQQSLEQDAPAASVEVNTIADSLGAPMHAPVSFGFVQRYVDRIVSVSDEDMRQGMRTMFAQMKLAVEPACAAPIAALLGPLSDSLAGKRVALIGCGSNIDTVTYTRLIDS